MTASPKQRVKLEREEALEAWRSASDDLDAALRMLTGTPPRGWQEKVAMARRVHDLYAVVIERWGLESTAPPHAQRTP